MSNQDILVLNMIIINFIENNADKQLQQKHISSFNNLVVVA